MLGTGCAVPSKHRAPAAIYLHAFARGGLLFDAGEGTLGQLHTLLGAQQAADALRRLNAIFISHAHADHHLGLIRVLSAVTSLRPYGAPLLVVGPRALGTFLSAYASLLPPPSRPRFVFESCAYSRDPSSSRPAISPLYLAPLSRPLSRFSISCTRPPLPRSSISCMRLAPLSRSSCISPPYVHPPTGASFRDPRCLRRRDLLQSSALGLRSVACVPVKHCADAWGFVVAHSDGWSVAYSGDTRPCEALVAAGRGVTLLIHEATFDDSLAGDAVQKRHSTRSEALTVACRMGAYRTLLTHLSQRYSREMMPLAPPSAAVDSDAAVAPGGEAAAASGSSLVAFDLMAVNLADLLHLPHCMGRLSHFFACEQRYLQAQEEASAAEQMARSERLEQELSGAPPTSGRAV